MTRYGSRSAVVVILIAASAAAQPPGGKQPILRLDPGGPTACVTALAFNRSGTRLYGAGHDKIVHVWNRADSGRYVLDASASFHVPIGPGPYGAIHALALSEDGEWLAVAGRGPVPGMAGFQESGIWIPGIDALDDDMRLYEGLIYVFRTRDRSVRRILRGHVGPVLSLAFAPPHGDRTPLLVSAGREWDRTRGKGEFVGAVGLWDMERDTPLLAVDRSLPNPSPAEPPPGLAPWRQADELRIGVTWNSQIFRVWDASRNRLLKQVEEGKNHYRYRAAAVPRPAEVVSLIGDGNGGRLQWRGVQPDASFTIHKDVALPGLDRTPQALALVGAHAVVLAYQSSRNEYAAQVLSLAQDDFGTALGERPLWFGPTRQPVVAAVGKVVAVAGAADNSVHVYTLDDLLNKRAPQVLSGRGQTFTQARPVRQGKDQGLLLRSDQGDKFVFDFAGRQLTDKVADWQLDAPNLKGWAVARTPQVEGEGPTRKRLPDGLEVVDNGKKLGAILLAPGAELTVFALLPPTPPLNEPLLAVAYRLNQQPALALYLARSRQLVRRFVGHLEPIHSLAFSADGRLLVSAAADRTVNVWSLTNLDRVYKVLGMVPGLGVRRDDDGVYVGFADTTGRLQANDRIDGFVTREGLQEVKSPRDFYIGVAMSAKPGETITVRVRKAGEANARDVRLDVGQGIDERRPLLTLFVVPGAKVADHQWICWHPSGTYDVHGKVAERLSWHENTGMPNQPVKLVDADQYRGLFHKEGFLAPTIREGKKVERVGVKPLERPSLLASIFDDGQLVEPRGGQHLVRSSKVTLRLAVANRPLNSLSELSWQLGDKVTRFNLDQPEGKSLNVDLRTLTRGTHRLTVLALPTEAATRDEAVPEVIEVVYRPHGPDLDVKALPRELDAPGVEIRGDVRSRVVGERVRLRVRRVVQGQEKEVIAPRAADPEFSEKVALEPGTNQFLIEVYHSGAPADETQRRAESTRRVIEVTYIKKDAPPKITLTSLVFLNARNEAVERLALPAKELIVVTTPRVRVEGNIDIDGVLKSADWRAGDGKPTPLDGFKATAPQPIRQELTLQPGRTSYHFTATTRGDVANTATVEIVYRPRLPLVRLAQPEKVKLFADAHPREWNLSAGLEATDNNHPFRATLRINDKDVETRNGRPADGKLTFKVPLAFGSNNNITVLLRNEWDSEPQSDVVPVLHYVRPPRVAAWKDTLKTTKLESDLEFEVASELPLDRDSVLARVNDEQELDPAQHVVVEDRKDGRWTVRLKKVRLKSEDRGKNVVALSLRNSGAGADRSEESRFDIQYTAPPPLRPEVVILSPAADSAYSTPEVMVQFLVKSAQKVKARVSRSGPDGARGPRGEWRQVVDAELEQAGVNLYRSKPLKVTLLEDVATTLEVEARPDDGEVGTARVTAVYRPPSVSVKLTALRAWGEPSAGAKPDWQDDRRPFATAPAGKVELDGKVVWSGSDDRLTRNRFEVRVYVNGIQQKPAELAPVAEGSVERTFRASVLLTLEKDNRIEVGLVGLPREKDERTWFHLDCAKPIRFQRLHLLIVSSETVPGDLTRYGEDLKKQILESLGASPQKDGRWKSPVFEEIRHDYDVLLGSYFTGPSHVRKQLNRIAAQIERFKNREETGAQGGNDVVLFYYRGAEQPGKDGLMLGAGQRQPMIVKDLIDWCARTPGMHILLFDVERAVLALAERLKDEVANWSEHKEVERHVAVMRFAWLGKEARKDPRLLEALQHVLPRSRLLKDVTDQLLAIGKEKEPMGLRPDIHLPEGSARLPVSGGPLKP